MCQSRYQRVVALLEGAKVRVQDAEETERSVSLLAYDGELPAVNDWLVVHSGYALAKVDPGEAAEAVAVLQAARSRVEDDEPRGSAQRP